MVVGRAREVEKAAGSCRFSKDRAGFLVDALGSQLDNRELWRAFIDVTQNVIDGQICEVDILDTGQEVDRNKRQIKANGEYVRVAFDQAKSLEP